MASLQSIYAQYRQSNLTFFFKAKPDRLVLKIFNEMQQRLLKKEFFLRELKDIQPISLNPLALPDLILKLKKHWGGARIDFASSNLNMSIENCQQHLQQMILSAKRQINPPTKDFECPVSTDVMEDPVAGSCGHMHDRKSLEALKNVQQPCSICRKPIADITPNHYLRDQINKWRSQEPIPTFALFEKSDTDLLQQNLSLLKTYIQKKEYLQALKTYENLCKYTRDWHHYSELPALFLNLKETEKATLAFLYLAFYQMADGQIAEAVKTLEECLKEQPKSSKLLLLLVNLYILTNQKSKAVDAVKASGWILNQQLRLDAIQALQITVEANPNQWDLYPLLAKILGNSPAGVLQATHLLLKGACQAFAAGEFDEAIGLCKHAETYSRDLFADRLVMLCALERMGKKIEIKDELLKIAQHFRSKNDINQLLHAYKLLIALGYDNYQDIIACYESCNKLQKSVVWHEKWIDHLLKEEKWETAEQLAQHSLKNYSRHMPLSLYLKIEKIFEKRSPSELEPFREQMQDYCLSVAQANHSLNDMVSLAQTFSRFKHSLESSLAYFKAAKMAYLKRDFSILKTCLQSIEENNIPMEESLQTQLQIFADLVSLREELQSLKNKVDPSNNSKENRTNNESEQNIQYDFEWIQNSLKPALNNNNSQAPQPAQNPPPRKARPATTGIRVPTKK